MRRFDVQNKNKKTAVNMCIFVFEYKIYGLLSQICSSLLQLFIAFCFLPWVKDPSIIGLHLKDLFCKSFYRLGKENIFYRIYLCLKRSKTNKTIIKRGFFWKFSLNDIFISISTTFTVKIKFVGIRQKTRAC